MNESPEKEATPTAFGARLLARIRRFGQSLSQEHLIVFDVRVMATLGVVFLLAILAVTFKIHGSSIHRWDHIFPDTDQSLQGLILGTPKVIRSDEWINHTPILLSQAALGYPVTNESLGGGKGPLFYNLPVAHFSTLFRPQFWGFFVLDLERAFAFYWAFKTFGFFLSSFLLMLLITRNRYWLSLFGAAWLYLSGFIQWFFSTPGVPDLIAFVSLACVAFIYLLCSTKKGGLLLSSALFALVAVNCALYGYLPFLIPLFYMAAFLVAGVFLRNLHQGYLSQHRALRITSLAVGLAIPMVVLALFYLDIRPSFHLLQDTIYPGARIFRHGGLNPMYYFNGFFDLFISEKIYPKTMGNVCVGSNFILLFPLVLVGLIHHRFNKIKLDPLETALLVYIVLLSIWLLWGLYPDGLAKVTVLNKVHPRRGWIGVGVASIFATVSFLSRDTGPKPWLSWWSLGLSAVVFVLLMGYGFALHQMDAFYQVWMVVATALFFTGIVYLFACGRRFLFSVAMLLVLLPNVLVNPIASGLRPVLGKEITEAARATVAQDPEARWLVFGWAGTAQFLKASGARVVNGRNLIPNFPLLQTLDPTSQHRKVYNRAAMIWVSYDKREGDVGFHLRSINNYELTFGICAEQLRSMGIGYLAFTETPDAEWLACAVPITRSRNTWIFKHQPPEDVEKNRQLFLRMLGGDLPDQETQQASTEQTFTLGSLWTVEEIMDAPNVWSGTWTRRGDTNIFDARWQHTTGMVMEDVIEFKQVEDGHVVLFRTSTKGIYRGTLSPDGRKIISGTADWYGPDMSWTATIE